MRLSVLAALGVIFLSGIARAQDPDDPPHLQAARARMVREQVEARGVSRPEVIAALLAVPRHRFVPPELVASAYRDHPLPIGEGQTISQPYIVALMTEALGIQPGQRVLEVGTGSGYQAAVLSTMKAQVYTIEIVPRLYESAAAALKRTGHSEVACRLGDGYLGWPEAAPFDAVLITAAVDHIPQPLISQMKEGGRLVLPMGDPARVQDLVRATLCGGSLRFETITAVRFVPMTGQALQKPGPR
jgi:protein-L-isoaspartate(D-aspartate) O-methyltransferase